jgi:hypothetical protein
MDEANASAQIVRFGVFEADLRSGDLNPTHAQKEVARRAGGKGGTQRPGAEFDAQCEPDEAGALQRSGPAKNNPSSFSFLRLDTAALEVPVE